MPIEYLHRIIALNIPTELFSRTFSMQMMFQIINNIFPYIHAEYLLSTEQSPVVYKPSDSTEYEESVGTVAYLSSDDGSTSSGKSRTTPPTGNTFLQVQKMILLRTETLSILRTMSHCQSTKDDTHLLKLRMYRKRICIRKRVWADPEGLPKHPVETLLIQLQLFRRT